MESSGANLSNTKAAGAQASPYHRQKHGALPNYTYKFIQNKKEVSLLVHILDPHWPLESWGRSGGLPETSISTPGM